LRTWFLQFEQQAFAMGIHNLDQCTPCLSIFMPEVIGRYIYTIAPTIKESWSLTKEKLLLQFGLPADVEQRSLIKKLR
ncbi:hypothetical protein EDC96DRAFT_418652, partial [Choanephora cucurbitarum]